MIRYSEYPLNLTFSSPPKLKIPSPLIKQHHILKLVTTCQDLIVWKPPAHRAGLPSNVILLNIGPLSCFVISPLNRDDHL
jgi:hypothetical protein